MGREIPLVKTKIPNDEYNELNIQGIECKINFNNNSVTFFPGGVGVFSTEILLNFDKEIDISLARNEIERVIENLITKYEKKVEHLNNHFLEYVNKPFKSLPIIISEYLTNGNFKFRWMHKIYWLYEEKSSDKDINTVFDHNLNNLLEQESSNISPFSDMYLFLGWGRSLIFTRPLYNKLTSEDPRFKIVLKLMDLHQRKFSLSLYQLQHSIIQHIFSIDQIHNNDDKKDIDKFTKDIEKIHNIRSGTLMYFLHLKPTMLMMTTAQESLLRQRLEEQWHFKDMERDIKDPADSYRERHFKSQTIAN